MAWRVVDRTKPIVDPDAAALLSEAVKKKILSFLDRYETKKAVLLPALHVVQNTYGNVSAQAIQEIAELLEISPAEVFDTISFYTHFWTGRRGRKMVVVCRSLTCEIMGSESLLKAVSEHLGIGEHQTTDDGEWSLMSEECIGACEHGPCMLINERLHTKVRPEDVPKILADPKCDKIDVPRSDLYDAPAQG